MHVIPTVPELVARGLAHPTDWTAAGVPTRYRITPEGHALLGQLMRENGQELRRAGVGDWVQPPSRALPPVSGES